MKQVLKSYAQKNGGAFCALTMSKPGHGFDHQYRRVDRFDETFIGAFLIGFDNFVHCIGIDQHQDGSTAGSP